jgi:5-aminolevulinate synthase
MLRELVLACLAGCSERKPSNHCPLPVIIGDAHQCRRTTELLLGEHGIYLRPISYPTVARGQGRLRITPAPFHTDAHMQQPDDALVTVRAQLNWSTAEEAA